MTSFTQLFKSRQALVIAALSSFAAFSSTKSESLNADENASPGAKSAGETIDFAPPESLLKQDPVPSSEPSSAVLDKHYRELARKLAAQHSVAELEKTTKGISPPVPKKPVATQPVAQTNRSTITYQQSWSNNNAGQTSSQARRGGLFGGRRTQSSVRSGFLGRRR